MRGRIPARGGVMSPEPWIRPGRGVKPSGSSTSQRRPHREQVTRINQSLRDLSAPYIPPILEGISSTMDQTLPRPRSIGHSSRLPGRARWALDNRPRIWSLGGRALDGRGAVRRGYARGVAWSVRLVSGVPGTRNHRNRLASASRWTRDLIATRASRGPIAWESGGNGPGTFLGK